MSLPEEVMRQICLVFAEESADGLEHLEHLLVDLSKSEGRSPPEKTLREICRIVHGLKGASGAIGFQDLERVFHTTETLVGKFREGSVRQTAVQALEQARQAASRAAQSRPEDLRAGEADVASALLVLDREVAKFEAEPEPSPAAVGGDSTVAGSGPAAATSPEATAKDEGAHAGADSQAEEATHDVPEDLSRSVRVPIGRIEALQWRVADLFATRQRSSLHLEACRALVMEMEEIRRSYGLLRDELERQAKPPAAAETIERAVLRATKSARDLEEQAAREARSFRHLASGLRAEVQGLRLRPFRSISAGLERAVRDLASSLGKRVRFSIEGADVELDRGLLGRIREPLLHLLRNSVDHGIETPEVRRRAGKREDGLLVLRVLPGERQVALEVEDDGRGIAVDDVLRRAVEQGIGLPSESDSTTRNRRAAELIFADGFTTASSVTTTSGRGVGLSAVRTVVVRLGGSVRVEATSRGVRFELLVPTDIGICRGLVVSAGGSRWVLPTPSVARLVRTTLRLPSQGALFELDGVPLPSFDLAESLGLGGTSRESSGVAIVARDGDRRAMFVIDEAFGEEEFVRRSLPSLLTACRFVSGAVVTGSGTVLPIVNFVALLDSLERRELSSVAHASVEATGFAGGRVLVAEDSHATRVLLEGVLAIAGYDVTTARDGAEAFDLLGKGRFDLLVSDLQMPNLDGIGLVRAVRRDAELRDLPVLLLTSLGSEADRAAGAAAGANAYFVKRDFEQGVFLKEVARLLRPHEAQKGEE